LANLTAFYDYILPDIPGIGLGLALQEIRNAVIEYCEKSLSYEYTLPAIDVVASTHTYTLSPETNTRVVDIKHVLYDDEELEPASEAELDTLFNDWRTTGAGTPGYYLSVIDRSSIRLVKTPSGDLTGGLLVKVAQAPLRAATTVPDWLLERKADAIGYGAKARLFAMRKKPWSDAARAAYYLEKFEACCGRGDIEQTKNFTRKPLRTTPVYR
jgi:hypothetical protein